MRVRNGKTLVTDGPFAETKEQLGGYYLIEAKDLDEAIEIAAQIPRRASARSRSGRSSSARSEPRSRRRGVPGGARARVASMIRVARRLRPRRGRGPGGVRGGAERWPRDGVPANPGAWIVTTARNRAIDRLRRERDLEPKLGARSPSSCREPEEDDVSSIPDERLA